MLKDPLTVIYDDINEKLGNPEDIKKVIDNIDSYDFKQTITIPGKASSQK